MHDEGLGEHLGSSKLNSLYFLLVWDISFYVRNTTSSFRKVLSVLLSDLLSLVLVLVVQNSVLVLVVLVAEILQVGRRLRG